MKLRPLPLLAAALLLLAAVAGCLRSISATPGTTPDGRPSVEVCAEVMAKAAASAAPTAVATVLPATRGRGVE